MGDLERDAPLVAAVLAARASKSRPMQIPGHKLRYLGGDTGAVGYDLLHSLIRDDVALQGGADDNAFSYGYLAAAEGLYARAIGASATRFLVGGSTQGNIAAFMSVAGDGTAIAVDRTSHRSALSGLILSGAMPSWIFPRIHPDFGIPIGMDSDALSDIARCQAVFLTSPSYVGTISDIDDISRSCHRQQAALIVDQAWGAHLDFGVAGYPSALAQGADIVITSTHKALLGYSQTATISYQGDIVDENRINRAVDVTATTSPSATLLASIDATRFVLQRDGGDALARAMEVSAAARHVLRGVRGVVVLDEQTTGCRVDPLKISLWLPLTGCTGVELAAALWAEGHGVESADSDTLVMTVSIADSPTDVMEVAHTLARVIEHFRREARTPMPSAVWNIRPTVEMSPREAFFAERERLRLKDAVGRVSAEQFCPYPPGVPLIGPGEVVTQEIIDAIEIAGRVGRVAYCSDPSLETIEVVRA